MIMKCSQLNFSKGDAVDLLQGLVSLCLKATDSTHTYLI